MNTNEAALRVAVEALREACRDHAMFEFVTDGWYTKRAERLLAALGAAAEPVARVEVVPMGVPKVTLLSDFTIGEHYLYTRPPAATEGDGGKGPPEVEEGLRRFTDDWTADDDRWYDAMIAFEKAVPHHQHGHSEWRARMEAAIKILAPLPAAAARVQMRSVGPDIYEPDSARSDDWKAPLIKLHAKTQAQQIAR